MGTTDQRTITLAVDWWASTFSTARRGLGGLRPRRVTYCSYYYATAREGESGLMRWTCPSVSLFVHLSVAKMRTLKRDVLKN